ncbi:MAG: hypothetical protein A2Y18_00270 [Clostridiales bacterium GWD2_32_19]|nr:MAG: hypothetical protein A2Y18_00270 [Clostridiales bacterium GWD2_32_19]
MKKRVISILLVLTILFSLISYPIQNKSLASGNDVDLKENPIIGAIANRETVVFLHEDTGLSGFGSNVVNVLGMTGGLANNSGELIKISGPTGIFDLRAGADNIFGLIPTEDNLNLYNIARLDANISSNENRWISSYAVKDFGLRGAAEEIMATSARHQTSVFIDEYGYVRVRGTNNSQVSGTGTKFPQREWPGPWHFVIDDIESGWHYALKPNGESPMDPVFMAKNNFNYSSETSGIKTIPDDVTDSFAVNIKITDYEYDEELGRTLTHLDPETWVKLWVLDENNNIIHYDSKTNYGEERGNMSDRNIAIDLHSKEFTNRKFRVKVESEHSKWQVSTIKREYLENAVKVAHSETWGRWSVITEDGKLYVNNSTTLPIEVNLSNGIRTETLTSSNVTNKFSALDIDGKLMEWTASNTLIYPIPVNSSFYDTYTIEKITLGNNYTMLLTKNKLTDETTVHVFGKNDYGKLGIENLEEGVTISEPTIITRKGEPLTDIVAVASGDQFSVIVQNTPEGQLVWSAGNNKRGQLGGGFNVTINKPQIVPGLSNIDRIYGQGSDIYAFRDSDKTVFHAGNGQSYFAPYTFPSTIGYPQKMSGQPFDNSQLIAFKAEDGKAVSKNWSIPTTNTISNYGYPVIYNSNIYDINGNSFPCLDANSFNNGEIILSDIKDISVAYRGLIVLDKNGRVWTSKIYWSGTMFGQGPHYTNLGERPNGTSYSATANLRAVKLDWYTYAEPIFKLIASYNDISSIGGNNTYAVDNDGKLWWLNNYINKLYSDLDSHTIESVFSGYFSVYFLDELGRLWVTGNGTYGRLGTASASTSHIPSLIPPEYFNNEKIVNVSSGTYATLFVTEMGNVYIAGTNYYGLFADPNVEDFYKTNTPIKIESLYNIKQVFMGEDFAMALDNEGRAWAWGNSSQGSLGNNFTGSRARLATAAGNLTPELSVENDISTSYYSKNSIYSEKRMIQFSGDTVERDLEDTIITGNVLGSEKTTTISEWELDMYDEVIPKKWEINWDVKDFPENMTFQSLTKIVAEDIRGGMKEHFFAGTLIIDNTTPEKPTWGEIYTREDADDLIEIEPNIYNRYISENRPVRAYFNIPQKDGVNKAPVEVQYQIRKKEAWGYEIWKEVDDLSSWTTVEDNYVEFFEGFQGEYEIRIRCIDKAGNASYMADSTRRFIINDAGPLIQDLKGKTYSEENVLRNEVTFDTSSNSERVSYTVLRQGERETEPKDLTTTPMPLTAGNMTFNDTDISLKGNETYKYTITGESVVTTGKSEEVNIITYPYAPKSMTTSIAESKDGLNILVDQDIRNVGKIKYRLVIQETDNDKNFHLVDIESSNNLQTLIYQVRQEDVHFPIINNPIDIKLLYKGYNDIWLEKKYDESEVVKPIYSADDKVGPTVSVKINSGTTKMIDNGTNEVNIQVVAVDDHTPIDEVQIQFSTDGKRWVGQHKEDGAYETDVFSKYSMQYRNFELGSGSGRKIVYVRAKDQTGNYGYAFAEIYVIGTVGEEIYKPTVNEGIGLTNPGEIGGGTKTEEGVTIGIETGNVYGEQYIYLKASQVQVKVSDYFTINQSEEVQYSTDGVKWSEWEPGVYFSDKELVLGNVDGLKAIFIRQRDIEGRISDVAKVSFMLDTTAPEVNIKSGNLSYIAVGGGIDLELEIKDNMLKDIPFSVKIEKYVDGAYSSLLNASGSTGGEMITKINLTALPVGRIKITVTATDGSGNITRINKILWSK